MLKLVRFGAIAALVMASTVWADDTSSMREEIADLRAKVASLESAEMAPSASGEAASLTSMKKKGSITIGGTAEMPIFVVEADDNVAGFNGEDDEILNTYAVPEMALKLNVQASKDMALKVKLDLEDTAADNDLLEEMYFNWKNVGGSPIELNIGKKEVPFGQDNSIGYHEPFVHGGVDAFDGTYLYGANYDAQTIGDNSNANLHANQPMTVLPGEIDNRAMIEAIYAYQKLLKLHVAVFQDTATMHDDRSNDTMFFQSVAAKLIVTPVEGLELSASFVNRHNDWMEDLTNTDDGNDLNNDGTAARLDDRLDDLEDDQQALSLAFDYQFKSMPIEIFGEYIHGWNQGYNAPVLNANDTHEGRWDDEVDTDTFQLGMIWGVTESIDLGLMVEYANIDIDDTCTDIDNDGVDEDVEWEDVDYWQAGASMYYDFGNGMYAGIEYYHVWMDGDIDDGNLNIDNDDVDADADVIGFVMGYSF